MASLPLAPVLDLAAAMPLRALLIAHRGAHLDLDAGAVTRLGGQCLQLLLVARRTWQTDGMSFRLTNLSASCRDALAITGADALLGAEDEHG